jgi:7-cyano-7-deazaguanine synthase
MVVLSGGQDSTTCLFWAVQQYGAENVYAITFDYGQRHSLELQAAHMVAHLAGIAARHKVIILPEGVLGGTSPLTDKTAELETYESPEQMAQVIGDRVEKTFVPMRNALFLTIAANRAVVCGCRHIVAGVCGEDNANYPDCRDSFIEAQEAAINEALGQATDDIEIKTPLMYMDKYQSVRFAMEIPNAYAALAWSHTAYDGKYPPTGKDHASILRAWGFERAGMPDPLVVRAIKAQDMAPPDAPNYTPVLIDAAWHRIADFLDTLSPTGRPVSTKGPNLQNIPIHRGS